MTFESNDIVEIEEESFVNVTGGCHMYALYSKILFEFVTKLAFKGRGVGLRERVVARFIIRFVLAAIVYPTGLSLSRTHIDVFQTIVFAFYKLTF
jgi:hypothetical protein